MIEVFAGIAILCATSKAAGLQNSIAVDKLRKRNCRCSIFQLDLVNRQDQAILEQWVESPLLLWIHLAPVCGTASKAREIRRFSNDPKPLRSVAFPEGLPNLSEDDQRRLKIANELFEYACYIFQLACSKGILATMENPRNSYFWITQWVLRLLCRNEIFVADFQVCMLGGTRDKWTRLIANFSEIQSMSIKCDRSHDHAPWGFAQDTDGKQVWATSLESAYPRIMCITLVNVVLQRAALNGLQLKQTSIADGVNPLCRAQNAQIHAGLQPKPSRVPPIVGDFAMVAVFVAQSLNSIPCSLMQKLPREIQLETKTGVLQTVPKHSRFLRFSAIGPDPQGEDQQGLSNKKRGPEVLEGDGNQVGAFEVAFGLPWDSSFIQQACKAGHPLLREAGLHSDLQGAIDKHMEWTDLQMCNYRISWCRRWIKRARELEAAERQDASKRHPNVAAVTSCKRLLLTQEILEDFGYEDVAALNILREGSTLAGKVEPCAVFESQFKPGIMTVPQLEASAGRRNELVMRLAVAHEDPTVDEQLWEETQNELNRGWAEGPFTLAELEDGATVSRRFALQQRDKTRMIDDFSISGVNDSCEAESKLDLHMIDTFCSMVRSYFESCGACGVASGLLAKTYDLKSAYRQVPIAPSHYKFAYFCLYSCKSTCAEIYRLRTMPFGATHSVYSFLRLAKVLHSIACRALYLLCTNFYDDFILASKETLTESASNSLELRFDLTGWKFDRDGKKATAFGRHCKALGVEFDFNRSKHKLLAVCNTSSRKEELIKQLEGAISDGVLDKQQSLVLRGRLGFADSFLHGRLGRMVLAKLVEHAYGRTRVIEYDLLMALKAMVHRLQCCHPRQVSTAEYVQWFVFSGASYEPSEKLGGLGGVLVDQSGVIRQWFGLPLASDQCVQFGAETKDTIIYELEMAATVLSMALWCKGQTNDLFTHFGDNDAVRFAFVRGTAAGPIAQAMMEHHLMLEAANGCRMWYARVATEANISDFPSRQQEHALLTKACDCSTTAVLELEVLLQKLVTVA